MANIAGLIVTAVVLLSGCTTLRRLQASDTEDLLAAAGFRMERVDAADATPGNGTSAYRLVSRTKADERWWEASSVWDRDDWDLEWP